MQWMFANWAAQFIDEEIEINCDIPEIGGRFDSNLHDLARSQPRVVHIRDSDLSSEHHLLELMRSAKEFLVLEGYFQSVRHFRDRSFYSPLVPQSDDHVRFDNNQIVINVRAGDVVRGEGIYPLVPPRFYKELISRLGLKPVFLGQLDDSHYVAQLKREFPDADYLNTAGPMVDLTRLRRARHLCVAVSTFSWVGAWLSEAQEVHFPLLGFLHPQTITFRNAARRMAINLCPLDDLRYRYHLFPRIYGTSEVEYLDYCDSLKTLSKEVSSNFVRLLVSERSAITSSLAVPQISTVDEWWYLRSNEQAAWEISEGLYIDPQEHFNDIGQRRGYRSRPPLYNPKCKNISEGGTASQSSLSDFSAGPHEANEAVALNKDLDYAFHTRFEDDPWWELDLGGVATIECIEIYNRKFGGQVVRSRIFPLRVETSLDGVSYNLLTHITSSFFLECSDGSQIPHQIVPSGGHEARYIKLTAARRDTALHLSKIKVFGVSGC